MNTKSIVLLIVAVLALDPALNSQAQSSAVRGKPLNPKTTVIIDYEDAARGNAAKPARPGGGGTANHTGAHFALIGGHWADAIPGTSVVDPALSFVVDLRGFPAGAEAAIVNAFAAWEIVTAGILVNWDTSTFGNANVVIGDGVNTYSLRNLGGGGVLASTYITWDDANNNGAIDIGEQYLEMDVIHNSTVAWGTDASTPPGKKWFDVQAVATHELGHVFGLAHPTGHPEDSAQTMYASAAPKETSKRTLEANGDIPGIQSGFLGYGAP